jgi:nucleoside diphosphate kinase
VGGIYILRKDYVNRTLDQMMEDIVQEKIRRIEMKKMQPAMEKAAKQYRKNETKRIYEELINRVKDDDFGVMY